MISARKQRAAWTFAILMAALAVPAGAAVRTAAKDALITGRIESTFLLNEQLNPFNINTTTKNGVVTLTGSVDEPGPAIGGRFGPVGQGCRRCEQSDQGGGDAVRHACPAQFQPAGARQEH